MPGTGEPGFRLFDTVAAIATGTTTNAADVATPALPTPMP